MEAVSFQEVFRCGVMLGRARQLVAQSDRVRSKEGGLAAMDFERHYNFHALRHSASTSVYRATKDLYLAQRFALNKPGRRSSRAMAW